MLASQIGCLNDSMEMTYAFGLLRERLGEAMRRGRHAPAQAGFERIIQRLESFRPEAMSVYVTSFTEDDDSLSQWRGYAEGEAGFALGFDPGCLAGASRHQSSYLLKVEYDPERQRALLDDVIHWTGEHFAPDPEGTDDDSGEPWAERFATGWLGTLTSVAACLKHPKFDDEREWRIVYYARDDDLARMQFIQRRATISRHIPLAYPSDGDGDAPSGPRLPLTDVVIGPCRYLDSTRYAVADLLKARGYRLDADAAIKTSRIPYRLI
ncbi:MAG TPA: DUF2971 domain-containing protein [Geminicoccus sp.]|uniref:DUF2971 domain-containing protein n=1 Tax=Geminicoccus sp. TaxID=2024832 RepID=UPI002CB5CEE6|nr:DUF2971 domain-containing protein [Geminicoccus sp.]HWL67969.1 DUF2971 domain-containing protein [Geminicoccus sp.]